jgi:hypothetical protein
VYATAWCLRTHQCLGTPPELIGANCAQISLHCPDVSFSDGSTRTPEGLLDCAEQIATYDCDAWNIDVLPECVTPGTRGPGEACIFSSQCQSLAWSGSADSCGACLRFATDADDCNDATVVTCEPGDACDSDTGRCLPRSPPMIAPVSNEPKGDPTADLRGAPCTLDSDFHGH